MLKIILIMTLGLNVAAGLGADEAAPSAIFAADVYFGAQNDPQNPQTLAGVLKAPKAWAVQDVVMPVRVWSIPEVLKGKFQSDDFAIFQGDLNGDGQPDYIVELRDQGGFRIADATGRLGALRKMPPSICPSLWYFVQLDKTPWLEAVQGKLCGQGPSWQAFAMDPTLLELKPLFYFVPEYVKDAAAGTAPLLSMDMGKPLRDKAQGKIMAQLAPNEERAESTSLKTDFLPTLFFAHAKKGLAPSELKQRPLATMRTLAEVTEAYQHLRLIGAVGSTERGRVLVRGAKRSLAVVEVTSDPQTHDFVAEEGSGQTWTYGVVFEGPPEAPKLLWWKVLPPQQGLTYRLDALGQGWLSPSGDAAGFLISAEMGMVGARLKRTVAGVTANPLGLVDPSSVTGVDEEGRFLTQRAATPYGDGLKP